MRIAYIIAILPATIEAKSASIKANGIVSSLGGASKDDVAWIDLMTVPEIAGVLPELSLLKDIYDATEFSFKLEQSRQITALMPTNDALTRSNIPQLLPCLPYESAVQLLQTLILDQVFQASEVDDGDYEAHTASGESVTLRIKRPGQAKGQSNGFSQADPSQSNGQGQLPITNIKHAINPTMEIIIDGTTQGVADNPFLDSANGVAYIIDTFPIPKSLQPQIHKALASCGTNPEKNSLRPADVPRHIDLTNRHHWFWGRIGGTPSDKFFSKNETEDPLGLKPPTTTTTLKQPQTTVGVIKRKNAPPLNGVLV